MPQADSIQSLVDSTFKIQQDSLIKPDSIPVSDSVTITTIKNVTFKGFEGVLHPSLPDSENWVFITLLILLSLYAFSFLRSSGWFSESIRTFFKVKERGSIFNKSTLSDLESRLLLIIFSTGVFSLYSYLILSTSDEKFSVIIFLKFWGVTTGFLLIKYLIIKVIGYVFLHPTIQKFAIESYFNVLIYLASVLFPVLVLQIYLSEYLKYYVEILSLILCSVALLLYITKLFLIFFKNLASSFYLLLYLCTLEILPVVLLFYLYNFKI